MTSDWKSVTLINYSSMCILLFGMDPFGRLGGHHSLQKCLEVKSDLRIEISDLKYIYNLSFGVSLLVKNYKCRKEMTIRAP